MITLRSLTKRYGPFTAVDSIDLEVAKGELFGFLGPNGAGKTTTLRMIAGILRPSSGSVVVVPAPLGPRNPNSSPLATSRSMESTAVNGP
jgi:ABC-2 type transport system ATP-binding protein